MTGQTFSELSGVHFLPLAVFLFSFLFGSIPFGLIIARIFNVKDLTKKGSGNVGATNVSRVVGFWPAGFLTFVLDFGKGVISVLLASPAGLRFLAQFFLNDYELNNLNVNLTTSWTAGLFVVMGHCFSPWLHFKGGKGVATGFGAVLVLSPIAALFGAIGFILSFLHKRIASLASITGLFLASIAHLVFRPIGVHLWFGAAMIFLILMRHEANIDALLEYREKPLK